MARPATPDPQYDRGFDDGFCDGLTEAVQVVAAARAFVRSRDAAAFDPALDRVKRALAAWDELNGDFEPGSSL